MTPDNEYQDETAAKEWENRLAIMEENNRQNLLLITECSRPAGAFDPSVQVVRVEACRRIFGLTFDFPNAR